MVMLVPESIITFVFVKFGGQPLLMTILLYSHFSFQKF